MKISKSLIIVGIIVIAIIALGGWYVSTRNGLVIADEGLKEQWGKVEVQYQRRLDLIPNLVETVKGYAAHESNTLEAVTQARAGLTDAYNNANEEQNLNGNTAGDNEQSLERYNNAQQQLGRALSIYVNAVHEAYPDLKADKQFLDLQTQLEGTENRIATERGRYTERVKEYNIAVRRFPASIVAGISGFPVKPQFQAEAAAASAPKVSF